MSVVNNSAGAHRTRDLEQAVGFVVPRERRKVSRKGVRLGGGGDVRRRRDEARR